MAQSQRSESGWTCSIQQTARKRGSWCSHHGWYLDPLCEVRIDTIWCMGELRPYFLDDRTVSPRRPHSSNTHRHFEVLFEARTEMRDTMCEADVSDYQADTCGRRGGRHRYRLSRSLSTNPVMALIYHLWQSGNLYDPPVALVEPLLPPDSPSPSPPPPWLLPKHQPEDELLCTHRLKTGNVDSMERMWKRCSAPVVVFLNLNLFWALKKFYFSL